jgi:hypothetical protein
VRAFHGLPLIAVGLMIAKGYQGRIPAMGSGGWPVIRRAARPGQSGKDSGYGLGWLASDPARSSARSIREGFRLWVSGRWPSIRPAARPGQSGKDSGYGLGPLAIDQASSTVRSIREGFRLWVSGRWPSIRPAARPGQSGKDSGKSPCGSFSRAQF